MSGRLRGRTELGKRTHTAGCLAQLGLVARFPIVVSPGLGICGPTRTTQLGGIPECHANSGRDARKPGTAGPGSPSRSGASAEYLGIDGKSEAGSADVAESGGEREFHRRVSAVDASGAADHVAAYVVFVRSLSH